MRQTAKTKTKTYRWKRAANVTADPNLVGAELEKLSEHGPLRADVVVEAARPHDNPMHRLFPCLPNGDWDDSEAARIGRESIAAKVLRSIEIVVITPDRKQIDTRAFVSMKQRDEPRAYMAVDKALESDEGRVYLLRRAWMEILACRKRYAQLTELADIWEAIDAAVAERGSKAG